MVEEICQCLESLLGLQFSSTFSASQLKEIESGSEDGPRSFSELKIPAELLSRLRESAKAHMVTDLESGFQELSRLGQVEKQLASQLETLTQDFELEQVKELLDSLS